MSKHSRDLDTDVDLHDCDTDTKNNNYLNDAYNYYDDEPKEFVPKKTIELVHTPLPKSQPCYLTNTL